MASFDLLKRNPEPEIIFFRNHQIQDNVMQTEIREWKKSYKRGKGIIRTCFCHFVKAVMEAKHKA
jgi:hypothetical protein